MAEISPIADLPPSEPTPTGDLRIPLGVRVIAGVLIVAGTCSLVHAALDWWTGRGWRIDLGPAVAFVGWGLLRRREWARVWAAIFAFPLMVASGALLLFIPFVDPSDLQLTPAFADAPPWLRKSIDWLLVLAVFGAGMWAFRYLQRERPATWFLNNGPLPRLIVWNPLRWRFGLGTLFILTAIVALASIDAMHHPGIRELQAQHWADSVDLSDPLYFPNGARSLPDREIFSHAYQANAAGDGTMLYYGVTLEGDRSNAPTLAYVVFSRSDSLNTNVSLGRSASFDRYRDQWSVAFHYSTDADLHFPGPIQLAEVVDNKLRTSDMHITLLEFWSYWNHPDVEWSLDGLERHVKDLRRRVAERDAGP